MTWMKRIGMLMAVAGVCVAMTGTAVAQDTQRIAFLNMERVFSEYFKTQRADARLKEQAEEYNEERNSLVQELREMEEAFNAAREEAQDQSLSEEARDRKRSEAEQMLVSLRDREKELGRFEGVKRKELEEQGRRMRSRIVDEINEVVTKFSQERELFAVVDSSGPSLNQIPVFVYSDKSADVTDEILALLNRGQAEAEVEPETEEAEADPVAP